MRVACPECATEYDVPETAMAAGRRLRCSACGTSWEWEPADTPAPQPAETGPAPAAHPQGGARDGESPHAAAPRAEPPAATEPPAASGKPAPEPQAARPQAAKPSPAGAPRFDVLPERRIVPPAPPPERGGWLVALAWVASLAIFLAAVAALYVWRAPIMQAWPPLIRLYTALGLA